MPASAIVPRSAIVPTSAIVPAAPRWNGPPLAPNDDRLAAAGIEIGPDTATPDWHGERLDLGYAIDVLWKPRTESGAAAAAAPA